MLGVPSEIPLAGTEGPHVPYFFVRDEGFALNRNILRLLVDLTGVLKKECTNIACTNTKVCRMCVWNFEQ